MLDGEIIACVCKAVDHSLSYGVDRNLGDFFPVDPISDHLDPPANVLYNIGHRRINQFKYIPLCPVGSSASFGSRCLTAITDSRKTV